MRLYAQNPYDAFYHRGHVYLALPLTEALLVMEPKMVANKTEFGIIRVCEFDTLEQGEGK